MRLAPRLAIAMAATLLAAGCASARDVHSLPRENLTEADRAEWNALLGGAEACRGEQLGTPRVFFHPVDADRTLVQITCSKGLYQGTQVFFLVGAAANDGASTLLVLPQVEHEEAADGAEARLVRFDDAVVAGSIMTDAPPGQLVSLRRFRGAGGCGTRTTWDVTGERPKILEFRARPDCTDEIVPAEQWPAVRTAELGALPAR